MVYMVYGVDASTCTQRVALAFHEKKVPFQFAAIDHYSGEHKSSEFVAKQPFGRIPYLDDDGFTLFESRAIGRYIASKHPDQGTPLIPTGEKALAKFEEAMSIEAFNFEAYAYRAVAEGVFKEMFHSGTPDPAVVKGFMDVLSTKLDTYEKILSNQKYLAGDTITLADINHLPYGSMLPLLKLDTLENPARPHVARWWRERQERPSWQAVKGGVKTQEAY
ncbi:glutathione S-transferase [Pterulicium gracile]|uniref:glutathione transferase n=1 Tax=Pterulicium gracile TaxID=1884261 RepID=A0A5C3QG46_9AGAR|nr:glutathione S-transferase [Pterula gracilis]